MAFKKSGPSKGKKPLFPTQAPSAKARPRKIPANQKQRHVATVRWVMVVGPTGKKRMVAFPLEK